MPGWRYPIRTGLGTPHHWDIRRQSSYEVGGMPLAFTQENCLLVKVVGVKNAISCILDTDGVMVLLACCNESYAFMSCPHNLGGWDILTTHFPINVQASCHTLTLLCPAFPSCPHAITPWVVGTP